MKNENMTREKIHHEVQEIFRDVLGKKDLVLTDTLTASDVKGWDSFAHVSLMTAIEQHYKIRFNFGELDQLTNVGDILSAIGKKTGK
jgi:acyl carrier protein